MKEDKDLMYLSDLVQAAVKSGHVKELEKAIDIVEPAYHTLRHTHDYSYQKFIYKVADVYAGLVNRFEDEKDLAWKKEGEKSLYKE